MTVGAADRYLTVKRYAVGDRLAEVASCSEAILTEYRLLSGGHTYTLSRALRGTVGRDLVFIDDRLACVPKQRRYQKSPTLGHATFWRDTDTWDESVYQWEWANEPGGLDYLAALLRESCGLEPVTERREIARKWSRRTVTRAEVADAARDIGSAIPQAIPAILLGIVTQGYGYNLYADEPDPGLRSEFERRDRAEIEARLWSVPLGVPPDGLAASIGVPDVQFRWVNTGTEVNAFHLGSPNRYFVGVVDGRVVWVHSHYPGLVLQSKIAAQRQSDAPTPGSPPAESPR